MQISAYTLGGEITKTNKGNFKYSKQNKKLNKTKLKTLFIYAMDAKLYFFSWLLCY